LLTHVLYVPSLQKKLDSLDNDGFDCHFGNGKCVIECNNDSVGLSFLKQDLYLLPLCENVNSICDVNGNVLSSVDANRKRKRKMHRRNYGTVV